MKKVAAFFLAVLFLSQTSVFAEGEKVITLKDGSHITGHIVALERGQYIVRTETLGEIRINEETIQSIAAPNMASRTEAQPAPTMAAPQPLSNQYSEQMKTMQGQILANDELMQEIAALAQDPEIINLLNDPALLEAATRGDPNAMQQNPRTEQLMSNPKMQELMRKIQQMNLGQPARSQ